jgi:hypothetical protein
MILSKKSGAIAPLFLFFLDNSRLMDYHIMKGGWMYYIKRLISLILIMVVFGFAVVPRVTNTQTTAKLVGDISVNMRPVPYLGDGRGPGDQIGMTWYDYQANGSFGQRIDVDDYGQAHIDWMKMDGGQTQRVCAWNARYTDGSYYGETPACWSWTGYVCLDITRDANPDDQRTVITFHEFGATYYSWIDIDGGNLWGTWSNDPKNVNVYNHVWPKVAVANNGNIVVATGDNGGDYHHLYVSTDNGDSWTSIADLDSCSTLSQHVRASENAGSNKVVFVNTSYITDSLASGQYDNNVYYMLSTDGGETWGSRVNLTNYQPSDSVRAYCNVNAVFDNNDYLHIAWAGRRVTDAYYDASNIFHWNEVSGTVTKVNSPSTYYTNDWWITTTGGGDFGGWRMPADQPQLIVDPNDDLYCLWHGNDDYNDFAADGYINGELYGAISHDNGATWTGYRNLTNTRSPGAASGACDDEDYMTACPRVVNDSIFLTYIEDKDAGAWPQTEGALTENPVRCWVFPKNYVGIDEYEPAVPERTGLALQPNPCVRVSVLSYALSSAGEVRVGLYDASGRLIEVLEQGYRNSGHYTLDIDVLDLASGMYFVVLDTPAEKLSQSLVIMH